MTAASRPGDPLPRLLKLVSAAVLTLALAGVLALPNPSAAQERVDVFDTKSRRTGYAVVDRDTGRVDLYNEKSRRTGWGKLAPSGKRIELFGLDGKRKGETTLPIGPERRQ